MATLAGVRTRDRIHGEDARVGGGAGGGRRSDLWVLAGGREKAAGGPGLAAGVAVTIDYRRNQAVDNDEYNQLRLRAWGREDGFDWQPVLARSLGWITAHVEGRLIGFVNVAWDGGGHMFLLDTTVDPDYQRRGIGN